MDHYLYTSTVGSGEPLVMLHGWGWHSAIWTPLLPELSKHFQLFLIDLPGFGQSPLWDETLTIQGLAKEIFKHVPEKATWLGWSLGGMIAWWIALRYPEKVQRLITVASSPKFVATDNWPGVSPPTLEKFKTNLTTHYQQTLRDFLDLQLRGSQNSAEILIKVEKYFGHSPTPITALLTNLELLQSIDLRSDLRKIRCASLHLFGSHDTLVPKEIANRLQKELPNSRIEVIKRAGHMPFLSHPEIFLEAVISKHASG